MRAVSHLTTLLLVVGVAAGCAASARAPTPAPTIPAANLAGITVELRQGRADWADRIVAVRIGNGTSQPVTVTSASLTSPTAEGTAVSDPAWSRIVPPGSHRDARVALGPPVCPVDAAVAGVSAEVRVALVDETGRTAERVLVPADLQGHLARIHGEDCAEAAVEAGATLHVDRLTTQDRDGVLVATLWLTAGPVPGGPPVTFSALDGSTLAAPVGGAPWSLTALGDPVDAPATVGLDFLAPRCDAHAVADDKRGAFFGVHSTVDGVEQPVWYVGGGTLRGDVHDYVARHCAWDQPAVPGT